MQNFQSTNFLNIDDLFSDQELQIRDSIRSFVSKEIIPIIGEAYEKGRFPKELIPQMAELGLLGSHIQGFECAGLSTKAYGLTMQELERGDSGIRSFVSVQGALCMHPIYVFGSDAQQKKYLAKMAKGQLIGCFGLTEPDFGSNPAGMITRAKKDGNDYILNGTKMWITNGSIADLAIVWAKDDEDIIRGFIVEKGTKGFSTKDIEKKFSLRASITSELHFDDCRVSASQLLEVKGLKGPFTCLSQARFGIIWGALGSAMACYHEALEYAKTRIQFDKPIASFQLVQAKLSHMVNEISKGQLLALRLAELKDDGKLKPEQISLGKMNNVSMALETARMARDILGASGVTYEYHCGRHSMNLESVNTYEGTEDIHRLIVGQAITGLSAFR